MLPILRAKKNANRDNRLQGGFERRLLFSILIAGAAGVVLSLLLLWHSSYSLDHKIEVSALVVLLWLGLSFSARDHVVNSLRVLYNVISAVKDEDFSFRATQASAGDALGDLALEINSLSRALAEERLGAVETTNLLRKVMAEAGTIIFAFSPDNRLRIVNRTGVRFLGKPEEEILNRTARELGIEDLVKGPAWEVVSRVDSGAEKRWIVRRATFRQGGEPHSLVVLSEASEALRAEERVAWQRLIRVLSHEINNSLAPIRTIARTLGRMASTAELPMPLSEHLGHGLEVIHQRADSLNRFLQSYTRVAKVPKPQCRAVALNSLVARVAKLESRLPVKVIPGSNVSIFVDPDQLEQALINLIKNAVDAVLLASEKEFGPEAVTVSWTIHAKDVEIYIRDEGIGLTETENLFVPFYTTKETGSGIGLLLSRQIIEAHQGTIMLRNRAERSGCEVVVKLSMCILSPLELSSFDVDPTGQITHERS
jgi:nitrogen fixation/metabolism regulation signal transduction histidine kinase